MTKLPLLLALSLLSACGDKPASTQSAPVASAEQLIEKSACLSCHQQGNQMKLPIWAEVAARYKKNKDAENLLVNKIARGGSGSWGKTGMPPYHPDLSEAERRVVAHWILSQPAP